MTLDRYSPAVQKKARAGATGSDSSNPNPEVKQDENDPSIWWVMSRRTGKYQRVQFLGEFVTCNCTHGKHSGGQATCYHACLAEITRLEQSESESTDHETENN